MRLQSRRAQAEQTAEKDRLREKIRDLEAEVLEQGRAAGRLARRTDAAEGSVAGARAVLAIAHKALKERCDQQQAQIDALRRDRDGLRRQLDAAIYTPSQRAVIDAGGDAAFAAAERAARAAAVMAETSAT